MPQPGPDATTRLQCHLQSSDEEDSLYQMSNSAERCREHHEGGESQGSRSRLCVPVLCLSQACPRCSLPAP